jgi:hypothetical protein
MKRGIGSPGAVDERSLQGVLLSPAALGEGGDQEDWKAQQNHDDDGRTEPEGKADETLQGLGKLENDPGYDSIAAENLPDGTTVELTEEIAEPHPGFLKAQME